MDEPFRIRRCECGKHTYEEDFFCCDCEPAEETGLKIGPPPPPESRLKTELRSLMISALMMQLRENKNRKKYLG